MSRTVVSATVETDKGPMKLTPQQLRKVVEDDAKRRRAGTMIGDGVMWCPNCGSHPVTGGHRSCRDCDPTLPMSPEEFRALKARNELEQAIAREEGKMAALEIDDETESDLGEPGDDEIGKGSD